LYGIDFNCSFIEMMSLLVWDDNVVVVAGKQGAA